MASRRKGRIAAFQALYAMDMGASKECLDFSWTHSDDAPEPEWLLFSRLLFDGTVEQLEVIDDEIKKHLEHWDIGRIRKIDLAILRLSVYALMFQSGIPATVTIDEAVHLAKEFSTDDSYRFINGVLDAVYHSQGG
ncbi:MAG: transcription antitermination factor NusB [Spirochaetaceae bacterium]|nr:MAG: transcription antitermination factor NusB [Spirochaetaceae bacterium]